VTEQLKYTHFSIVTNAKNQYRTRRLKSSPPARAMTNMLANRKKKIDLTMSTESCPAKRPRDKET
jgi:hypothetical protein